MTFKIENLSWRIGRKTILDDVSLEVVPGKMMGLLGPNGSGKTSLLRIVAGLKKPHTGRVTLEGVDLTTIGRRTLAQRVAFVEQHGATNSNLTVLDVVKLGRFPHRSMFSGWSEADDLAVEQSLERAGMRLKRNDRWQSLSGGEKQRAHIARALAQSPKELLLDEPTNHLDIQHQLGLMRLVAGLPMTSVIALHDLNHAAMFCDTLVVMQAGKIIATGAPEAVVTQELLRDVFSVDARIETSPYHARPHIHFL